MKIAAEEENKGGKVLNKTIHPESHEQGKERRRKEKKKKKKERP